MDAVSEIREKIDIVSLIAEYLPLKKLGRNFKTNCPFHGEKTPSFVVSPERQIWHCFGCNKGGDCFTFLMEYENLEFVEALRTLAKRAGITLPETKYASGVSSKKDTIFSLNRQAAEFYHYVLTKHTVGKKALSYLTKERGIHEKVIETFLLGYSPSTGNALVKYLMTKKGHKREDIIEAGLGLQKGSGIGDFFVGRTMFPLFDHRGNIEGFSGRLLGDTNTSGFAGKYVNTRETLVYHKGSVFFGLNIAKEAIKKQDHAIIMEGEFDVISSFQEGVANVIAVKGTALTENQVQLISRFCQKVSLCFDRDAAGKEAIKRSLAPLEKKNITVSVIVLQDAKDPDEAIKKDPYAFKKAVKQDIGVYDYLLQEVLGENNKASAEGKKNITDELLPFFEGIENEVIKEHYLRKLAGELDTSYESISRQAEKIRKKDVDKQVLSIEKEKRQRQEILEEYLLAILVQSPAPKEAFFKVVTILTDFIWGVSSYQKVFEELKTYLTTHTMFEHDAFSKTLPKELLDTFNRCYLLPVHIFENDTFYAEEIEKVAYELQVLTVREKIKLLGVSMKDKEKDGENEDISGLQQELSRLVSLLPITQK